MVRKQFLRAYEHYIESHLEKVKSDFDQKKLTFNITFYPFKAGNILQEIHILLMPDEEHKKVFQDTNIVGFLNDKSIKDDLFRAKLTYFEITGSPESCENGNCQVFDFICVTDTFSLRAQCETFKIQSGTLNCNSQKVVYLLKFRICGEAPYVAKTKTKT